MPSFDIVSEITLHEVRNAVENANSVLTLSLIHISRAHETN